MTPAVAERKQEQADDEPEQDSRAEAHPDLADWLGWE
jgi:hypothetical protein